MTAIYKPLVMGLLVGLVGALAFALGPWIDLEQDFGLPWLYQSRGAIAAPQDVVIVAIDERTAEQLELPEQPRDWPHSLHAELVRTLSRAGARLIVFDMTFERPSALPEHDVELAAAMADAGNVLATVSARKDVKPLDDSGGRALASLVVEQSTPPLPIIEKALRGNAPFMLPKAARIDAYWAFRTGGADSPTLPLLALQAWQEGRRGVQDAAPGPSADRQGMPQLRPATHGNTSYLNFYGPPRTLRTLSYADVVLRARGGGDGLAGAERDDFRDKAVFIGYSAITPGGQNRLRDDHRTVYSQSDGLNLSGVEIAATAFANLLEDRPLRPLDTAWQLVIILAWGLLLAVVAHRLRPAFAAGIALTLVAPYLWLVSDRFADAASWWPLIIPVAVQTPLALLTGIITHYGRTRRERDSIERTFEYFLPPSVVEQLARNAGELTKGNAVVFGSCLATDITDYTTLAEQMDPAALGKLLNDYFAELFVPVERSGGVVVDVVGDAMVAVWTAAAASADVRHRACAAALEIVAALDRFNRASPGRPPLATRLGLHCGDILVGNVGASRHFEYRAVGDIVNTASRVQNLNKSLGTRLLASAAMVEGLEDLLTRPLGSFRLAGKASALPLVELLGAKAGTSLADQRRCERFALALAHHDAQRWDEAVAELSAILAQTPDDGPSRFYLSRCAGLAAQPPQASWSPTVVMETK